MITNPSIPQRFHDQSSWEGKICFKHKRLLILLHCSCVDPQPQKSSDTILSIFVSLYYVAFGKGQLSNLLHFSWSWTSFIFSCSSQQSPQWNQSFPSLSSASSFLAPATFMSSFTTATNPLFGLSLGLLSGWINYLSGYLKSTTFFSLCSL